MNNNQSKLNKTQATLSISYFILESRRERLIKNILGDFLFCNPPAQQMLISSAEARWQRKSLEKNLSWKCAVFSFLGCFSPSIVLVTWGSYGASGTLDSYTWASLVTLLSWQTWTDRDRGDTHFDKMQRTGHACLLSILYHLQHYKCHVQYCRSSLICNPFFWLY